jgi:ArsR family transcriptional regulator, arsenate/arsenite/antimonite-responsive transcriptional repressor
MKQPLELRPLDELRDCCPDLFGGVLSDEEAALAASLFRALADPARVKLLSMIAAAPAREACVCDLVDTVALSQPTVSHHLKVLLEAGLVERERRGTWAYYSLRPGALQVLSRAICAPDALGAC